MSLFKSTKHTEYCPQCQSALKIKRGKQGLFLGCSAYPECDYLKPLQQHNHVIKELNEICPECGALLQLKQGNFGMFIGCSEYPECHFTVHDEPETQANILCPECKTHQLVERVGRSGKHFYGCSNYPHCKFTLASKPTEMTCPNCHYPLAIQKKIRGKFMWQCANRTCQHLYEQESNQEEL